MLVSSPATGWAKVEDRAAGADIQDHRQHLELSISQKTLNFSAFEHVEFRNIAPTRYQLGKGGDFIMYVQRSSSAFVRGLKRPLQVQSVRFRWRSEGRPEVRDQEHEASREGDDAVLRVGLMLAGPRPFLPFFAPDWVKQTAALLNYPSDRMLFLTPMSKHPVGTRYTSPAAKAITSLSLPSEQVEGKRFTWWESSWNFDQPQRVVGIWLMSDGDNTRANFTVWLQELELVEADAEEP